MSQVVNAKHSRARSEETRSTIALADVNVLKKSLKAVVKSKNG